MENKILAIVNGIEVTQSDIDQAIQRFPQDKRNYLKTSEGQKQLLNEIISFELIYDYAKENNMDKDDMYVSQLNAMAKELLTQYAMNKLFSGIDVSDKDTEEYYEKNKEMFKSKESISAKHILVDSLEKAQKIAEEIKSGLSFEEAARKYSSCPSKSQGGSLGTFTRGQMVPEFEQAAFSLAVGELSDPVKTQFGYHLIKVEEKNESSVMSYDEVKNEIVKHLNQEKQTKKYMNLVENLKKQYNVVIK